MNRVTCAAALIRVKLRCREDVFGGENMRGVVVKSVRENAEKPLSL